MFGISILALDGMGASLICPSIRGQEECGSSACSFLSKREGAWKRAYGVGSTGEERQGGPLVDKLHVLICADGFDGLREEGGLGSLLAHLFFDEGVGLLGTVVEDLSHFSAGFAVGGAREAFGEVLY